MNARQTSAPAELALDYWLVHPAALHERLCVELAESQNSELHRLRVALGCVQCCDDLAALTAALRQQLHGGEGDVRIVLEQIDREAIDAADAAGPLSEALARRIHLHAFSDDPLAVLATLSTPETAVEQAFASGVAPALRSGGKPLAAGHLERYMRACEQWRAALDRAENAWQELTGEEPKPWGASIWLQPDMALARLVPLVEDFEWVRGHLPPSLDPQARRADPNGERVVRWAAAIQGQPDDAVVVEMVLPALGAGDDATLKLMLVAAGSMMPRPGSVTIGLADRSRFGPVGPLLWRTDPGRSRRAVAVAALNVTSAQQRSLRNCCMSPLALHRID